MCLWDLSREIGKFGALYKECILTLIKTSSKSQKRIAVVFFFILYRFPATLEHLADLGKTFLDEGIDPLPHLVSRTTVLTKISLPDCSWSPWSREHFFRWGGEEEI